MSDTKNMGVGPINKLLIKQSLPSAIGILTLSINGIVDSIFLGNFIGSLAIGAVTVVLPITFLISSLGMAIGVGGGSVIARAFGAGNKDKALYTFGNQTLMTLIIGVLVLIFGTQFVVPLLELFGGKGDLLEPSLIYFNAVLPGIPFLAWAMMSNNVLRAEGAPKVAMITMLIPAIVNLTLDPILIVWMDMGIYGAGIATLVSYIFSALFTVWYFAYGKSQMSFNPKYLKPNLGLMGEIIKIGAVTLGRQGAVSLLAIILNNTLFKYGGEIALSAYGIISRVLMLAFFPVFGVTQGFLPIAGFNHGAKKFDRVKESISVSVKYGSIISFGVFVGIMLFARPLVNLFTNDPELINLTVPALRWVFLATPLITVQLISSGYYQSIGRAFPALILTLLKQLIFLIPILLILSHYLGLVGIWYAFPISDLLTAIVSGIALKRVTNHINRTLAGGG